MAVIGGATLGCGGGGRGNATDGARADGTAPDASAAEDAALDQAPVDGAAHDRPAADLTPPDGDVTVCAGDRWAGTATMLDALAGCTVIDGNLSVTGNELRDVDLPRLTRVEGFLTVWGNPTLTRASFPALARIGGYLDVSSNATLGTLQLPALASVNERSLLVANNVLIRDNALPACQTDPIRQQLAAHGVTDKVTIVPDGVPCTHVPP